MALPIDPTLWISFVAASAVLAIIPGPIVTLVIANSLSQGTRAGAANVLGTLVGNAALFTIGGLGMTWILTTLTEWFDVLRIAGAAYLIYLGIRQWRAKPEGLEASKPAKAGRSLFLQGVVVAITNPKTIVFYAAFFPQFTNPTLPISGQLAILSMTFLVVAGSLDLTYAALAGRLRQWLSGKRRARIRNRITGALLMGTGAALALARR